MPPTPWQPHWSDSGPWTEPLQRWAPVTPDWPSLDWLNAQADDRMLRNASGQPLRFVEQASARGALAYEQHIFATGEIPTRRGNWHDWFNALSWLRFPRLKAALNRRHVEAGDEASLRGRVRDALTLFDECGIIVAYCRSNDAVCLQAHGWTDIWWTQRNEAGQRLNYTLFGHSEFEKGLAPFRGWTAKALWVQVSDTWLAMPREAQLDWLDATLGEDIGAGRMLRHPRDLTPLPVLGVPGWWSAQNELFYADTDYFRPKRQRTPAGAD